MSYIDKLLPNRYIFDMKKKKNTPEVQEVSPVKLKPFLGMQPGLYLTLLYAFMLLLALFLVLIFPGLKNNGSEVSFESSPSSSAVYLDDVYLGSTPFTVFIKKGEHSFTYEKPYFEPAEKKSKIDGRIFGSLIFPRRQTVEVSLVTKDLQGYLNNRFRQVSNWALAGTFFDRYTYPKRGSQAVEELVSSLETAEIDTLPPELYNFAYMLINNINSKEMLEDIFSAFSLLEGPSASSDTLGDSGSPGLTIESFSALPFFSDIDIDLFSLYTGIFLEKESGVDISSLAARIADIPFEKIYTESVTADTPIRFSDHSFIPLGVSGLMPVGNEGLTADLGADTAAHQLSAFPHEEPIGTVYFDSSEITRSQFMRFVSENSRWSGDNAARLMEDNLVDEGYLSFLDDESYDGSLPVTGVSWYAAAAFCEWLTGELPRDLQKDYLVRLPTEAEWEVAARLNGDTPSIFAEAGLSAPAAVEYLRTGRLGLADMTGNVWEWCENWYFPSDLLDGVYGLRLGDFEGVEKSIRGGSRANSEREITAWTRASQPPDWCSPFTGFRVVLAPRDQ